MATTFVLNIDLANVYRDPVRRSDATFLTTLAWGDHVDVDEAGSTGEFLKVRVTRFVTEDDGTIRPVVEDGYIRPSRSSGLAPSDIVIPHSESKVLKVNFIDVQQGDASVIESPAGKVILIDGGDNQLFARYLANRFRHTSLENPRVIDAIVISHGDADHFEGLAEIFSSETNENRQKRLFIRPERVFHNGLVKRPGKIGGKRLKEEEMLGRTAPGPDGRPVIIDLVDDLLAVPDSQMNQPFRRWKRALEAYRSRTGPITLKRLQRGDDQAFDFVSDEGIGIEVLGPFPTAAGNQPGLRFLRKPEEGPRIRDREAMAGPQLGGLSASHTINGHSIVFRLSYGRFHFLFAGDLNEEAEHELLAAHEGGAINLQSEIFKVPHHGSADFSGPFLNAVAPVVSVVSSGDENARKEYIHPRANLVGALGRNSRIAEPLIFVTELAAFFEVEGWTNPEAHELREGVLVPVPRPGGRFFAFRRTAFGAVKVRTDGTRLLVYTSSGQKDLKEAYAFRMDPPESEGAPDRVTAVPVVRT